MYPLPELQIVVSSTKSLPIKGNHSSAAYTCLMNGLMCTCLAVEALKHPSCPGMQQHVCQYTSERDGQALAPSIAGHPEAEPLHGIGIRTAKQSTYQIEELQHAAIVL